MSAALHQPVSSPVKRLVLIESEGSQWQQDMNSVFLMGYKRCDLQVRASQISVKSINKFDKSDVR